MSQDIVRGHPGRVLASYSARADLVVLGRHSGQHSGMAGVGSIQHPVLNHAHGPIAIVPFSDGVQPDRAGRTAAAAKASAAPQALARFASLPTSAVRLSTRKLSGETIRR